jgi:hypothetical protein
MENKGCLSAEFRGRTKPFAAGAIRLYIKPAEAREEVKIPAKSR